MAWLDGWGNNIFRFSIDHTKIDSNLTNFPLLVTLSGACGINDFDATNIFDELGSSKEKIAVTTADGTTQCPVEIEYWDATEEVAHLWTKVPTVYSTVDTTMYLYYDSNQSDNINYISESTDPRATLVIDVGMEGTYDPDHVNQPCVIKDGSIYKMWYRGNSTYWCILYATSTDATTWSGFQMVIDKGSEGSDDTVHTGSPAVIKDGSIYKMWYCGHGGVNWKIIYTESDNGTTWSGFQTVIDKNSEGTYDTAHAWVPTVIKDGATYKIWYTGSDGANYRTIYATSPDGINWSNFQLAIPLSGEAGGSGLSYDTVHAYCPHVIKDDSTYKMWYTGSDGSNYRIIYCTSTNGITWSNHQLVLDIGIEGTNDTVHVHAPTLIKDNAIYRMWYSGNDATTSRILYTRSYDGIKWQTPSQAVWDNYYTAVYHMSQDPSGGSGAIKESTYNENHSTASGTMASNDLVTGKIDGALDFDGSDDYISCSDVNNLDPQSGPFMVESCVNVDDTSVRQEIIGKQRQSGDYDGWTFRLSQSGNDRKIFILLRAASGQHIAARGATQLQDNVDYNVVFRYDGSTAASGISVFINNVEESMSVELDSLSGGISTDVDMHIGSAGDTGALFFSGVMDEVRVSNLDRSDGWIKATYYSNWNELLTFDPHSYLEGQCTDRYGIPMDEICYVTVLDEINHSVLGYGTTVSGTGRFSIRVFGRETGSKVLVAYGYPGNYLSSFYPAGAEYMTTISGTTISGGGY